jgi:hypothetical protein
MDGSFKEIMKNSCLQQDPCVLRQAALSLTQGFLFCKPYLHPSVKTEWDIRKHTPCRQKEVCNYLAAGTWEGRVERGVEV